MVRVITGSGGIPDECAYEGLIRHVEGACVTRTPNNWLLEISPHSTYAREALTEDEINGTHIDTVRIIRDMVLDPG